MSERDDLAEQAYSTVPIGPGSMTGAERDAIGRRFDEVFPPGTDSSPVPDQIAHAMGGMDYMLSLQRDVEGIWGRLVDPADPAAVSKYIREVVLCATDELHEVLAEVHWKPWKSSHGIKDMSKYREEMADVLHFILDLYLAAGLTGQDIVLDYVAKHYENLERNKSASYRAS